MSFSSSFTVPPGVLARWSRFVDADTRLVTTGLINLTLELKTSTELAILQRLHPVFAPAVNMDIVAISKHLASKGMLTPRLLPTDDDALWVEMDGIWRIINFIPGVNYTAIPNPDVAKEAGRLVGKFHAALADFEHSYQVTRTHVHDTKTHLLNLSKAIDTYKDHSLHARVAKLAENLLLTAEALVNIEALPMRHAHGDLKISNLMFDTNGQCGLALIDLDTLTKMAWPLEMGDALRSWCNPRKEDQHPARLDLTLLRAAIVGYKETSQDLITQAEWDALIPGLARICLELSARFLTDALKEQYFAWDMSRYASRGEHNLSRGAAMWDLYQDVMAKQELAQKLI